VAARGKVIATEEGDCIGWPWQLRAGVSLPRSWGSGQRRLGALDLATHRQRYSVEECESIAGVREWREAVACTREDANGDFPLVTPTCCG
jgi:hypothetical protein